MKCANLLFALTSLSLTAALALPAERPLEVTEPSPTRPRPERRDLVVDKNLIRPPHQVKRGGLDEFDFDIPDCEWNEREPLSEININIPRPSGPHFPGIENEPRPGRKRAGPAKRDLDDFDFGFEDCAGEDRKPLAEISINVPRPPRPPVTGTENGGGAGTQETK
ncbi:hypothetical protein FN846DRAFT_901625 [Sphaerosporella brunnea]|uniref:Uncharacterized protein n=1 Tax=Sphaerosporella brunnea TaxID=1250544 RepID=A0A5J5FBJ1_9PEZI|nr:hypothetical protein FN846DRAFT_901625 [Sphaerosporella brunnea]